jgi:uncharacterized MAPEG superfamily protein
MATAAPASIGATGARTLRRAQLLVGAQIALSVPLQLLFVQLLRAAPPWTPAGDDAAARLAFALTGTLVAGTALLAMIMAIAGLRPLWAETIEGSPDAARLERHVRVQRNTLEQLMLFVLAHLSLALSLPREDLALLPALALLFVVARALYWLGYALDPMYRTFGFVATFYPNIYAIGLALYGALT